MHTAAPPIPTSITGLRPIASDSGPVATSPAASKAVDTESTRLARAASISNSRDSTGSSGCTQ